MRAASRDFSDPVGEDFHHCVDIVRIMAYQRKERPAVRSWYICLQERILSHGLSGFRLESQTVQLYVSWRQEQ